MFSNYESVELKDYEVKVDEKNKKLFLKLVYVAENKYGVFEITIPKVLLDISTKDVPRLISRSSSGYVCLPSNNILSTGEMVYFLDNDKDNNVCTVKKVEGKIHEMTISEIENKLGYKIKIISDETHVS